MVCVEGRWNGCSTLISIINVYAPQDDGNKRFLWMDICSYLASLSNLFCVMGNFNYVRKSDECTEEQLTPMPLLVPQTCKSRIWGKAFHLGWSRWAKIKQV